MDSKLPRISLVIEADDQRWQLLVGNKTAPGDQVFLRVVGTDGAFVADADWLKYIPRSADDWRDTALVNFNDRAPDWIVLTNGTKVIELHRNATNHLWQMTRPLVARANSGRITEALQRLQTARVSQFVTDNPKADLSAFELQPADLGFVVRPGNEFCHRHPHRQKPDHQFVAGLCPARRLEHRRDHRQRTIVTVVRHGERLSRSVFAGAVCARCRNRSAW